MFTGADAEAHQQQRSEEREQRLTAGEHHHGGLAELTEGVERNQPAQVLHNFNRPTEVDRPHVGGPEQIAVSGFIHLFERVFQLAVGDFQLGQFEDQRVAALKQRVQQLTLGAQLGFQNAIFFAGQRLAVSLANLPQLRLLIEQIFIT